jgi:hypothetical protein
MANIVNLMYGVCYSYLMAKAEIVFLILISVDDSHQEDVSVSSQIQVIFPILDF